MSIKGIEFMSIWEDAHHVCVGVRRDPKLVKSVKVRVTVALPDGERIRAGMVSFDPASQAANLLVSTSYPTTVELVIIYDGMETKWSRFFDREPIECEHDYQMSRECGVRVCSRCGDHLGLARCYCGWSRSGGDGRAELEAMGEQIDPD